YQTAPGLCQTPYDIPLASCSSRCIFHSAPKAYVLTHLSQKNDSDQIKYLAREIRILKSRYPGFTYHITSGDTEQVTESS
ncbi:MAG: hypothetical protein K6E77_03170, partial [Lachnospiraceae bacterium]|nr:hypothetical protein [Lachnospiraceae bacterium]